MAASAPTAITNCVSSAIARSRTARASSRSASTRWTTPRTGGVSVAKVEPKAPGAKTIAKVRDLTPDPKNANRHTQRGQAMTETSIRRYKFGRSVLVDKNGKSIAGAGVIATAADVVGTDADVVVVKTDGTKLVVVQRTDLDIDTDVAAKELAIADNRTNQVGLDWDVERLQALETEGVQIGQFFRDKEWDCSTRPTRCMSR
jgi:hypothetical protein